MAHLRQYLSLVLLALASTAMAASEGDPGSRITDDAQRFGIAIEECDADTVLRLGHPRLVEFLGGAAAVRADLKRQRQKRLELGLMSGDYAVEKPLEYFSHKETDFVLVRTRWTIRYNDLPVTSKSFLIGVRTGEQSDWRFIDGNTFKRMRLRKAFPDFPSDRQLPMNESFPAL